MDTNKKTALNLWNERIGKSVQNAYDFAGRPIKKGAYGDTNSKYGWDLDHIIPISKNGKNEKDNLQIVNILTNREKGNNFPDFNVNNKEFKAIKENGKLKIVQIDKKEASEDIKLIATKENTNTPKTVEKEKDKTSIDSKRRAKNKKETSDDASNNILLTLKRIKELDINRKVYTGSILIRLKNLKNESLIKFIKENFNEEDFIFFNVGKRRKEVTNILIRKYDISLKKDNKYLMDKCVYINTYLKNYFLKKEYFKSYDIHYEISCLDDNSFNRVIHNESKILNNMYFNDLVVSNMMSEEVLDDVSININHFNIYDLEIKSLKEELFKEVNRME